MWDGLDGFGDPVVGAVKARLSPELLLPGVYYAPADGFESSFGPDRVRRSRATPVPRPRGCSDVSEFGDGSGDLCAFKLVDDGDRVVGSVGRTEVGLGGWDLDAHHVYDALAGEGPARRRHGPAAAARSTSDGCAPSPARARRARTATTSSGRPRRAARRLGPARRLAGIHRTPAGEASQRLRRQLARSFARRAATAARARGASPGHDLDGGPPGRRVVLAMEHSSRQSHLRGDPRRQARADRRRRHRDVPDRGNDCRGDGGPAKDAPIHRPTR